AHALCGQAAYYCCGILLLLMPVLQANPSDTETAARSLSGQGTARVSGFPAGFDSSTGAARGRGGALRSRPGKVLGISRPAFYPVSPIGSRRFAALRGTSRG